MQAVEGGDGAAPFWIWPDAPDQPPVGVGVTVVRSGLRAVRAAETIVRSAEAVCCAGPPGCAKYPRRWTVVSTLDDGDLPCARTVTRHQGHRFRRT